MAKPRASQSSRRWVRRILIGTAALGVVLWLASGALASWMLTRRPRPRFEEPVPALALPDAPLEAVRLQTSDGETLGAWFLRGQPETPIVLILHGIADSRRTQLGLLTLLGREGVGVLALSLRAHGDSTGDRCDVGWSSRHDVVAAVEFIERAAPKRPIIVFGISMGAAAATFAASALKERVAGYILEAPFSSLSKAVWVRVNHFVRFPLSNIAFAALRLWSGAFLPVSLDEISPLKHIVEIPAETPVLLIGGGRDWEAPAADIQRMAALRGPSTRLIIFPEAAHVRAWRSDPKGYEAAVTGFVRDIQRRKAAP
jgi:alpha-beta hydrolase superfamily lysophospholipase